MMAVWWYERLVEQQVMTYCVMDWVATLNAQYVLPWWTLPARMVHPHRG
jgi:hypothetical protein